jgi:hypothetical protein
VLSLLFLPLLLLFLSSHAPTPGLTADNGTIHAEVSLVNDMPTGSMTYCVTLDLIDKEDSVVRTVTVADVRIPAYV